MTIKEIAELAGVSISTVSKIMNHKDNSISAETRNRVLKIAKEFNYTPYSNAMSGNAKTFILGVLLRSSGSNLTLNGIIEAARALGYTVLVADSAGSLEQESKGIAALCRHSVDGMLWEPVGADSLRYADSFRTLDIPWLCFNSWQVENACNIDFEQMAYLASSELVTTRHTDIACLLSDDTHTDSFLNGYRRCLFDAGIAYQENMVFYDISEVLLNKITNHSITGIVNSHFSNALRLYGNLGGLHYQIPLDVSLISLRDDIREAIDFPQISTFTIPHFLFGKHLCRRLINLIEHPAEAVEPFLTEPVLNNHATISIPFTQRTKKLTVVGSINIDHYLKVDELPTTGKATITSTSAFYPGGKAINQAIGAAKLGTRVAVIGNVGNDVDSNHIFTSLQEHSIDSGGVRRCTDVLTGKAYIFVQQDGDSMISILSGANGYLSSEDIQRNERSFENSSYCLVQTEVPQEAIAAACQMAHKYGAKTILKPAACSFLMEQLLAHVDILVPNFDEVNVLCPSGTLREKADFFLASGVDTVIITLGQEGCYVKNREWEESFPAMNFQSVDNTGAGDAFICALAVYLKYGYELTSAVRIATYAAGFSTTREGVVPALIDKNTLESYIRQVEPELLNH